MARTGNVLLALVTGVAIGVGAGILFAPDNGKNTRKKIKNSVDDTAEKLKKKLDVLTQEVKSKTSEIKGSLEENVENLVSKSSYKAEDVITVLERKLAALKEANAKLQK
ncbi:YtxH domain-containing protein [Capnocytophaga sp.]|uniref:YtxH domain-containing protein n=1 Tax=Capnocytophaga sp. TaxID=44737 RepID=UPI0026DABE11|nr:YtxH domain-containing protein [Capnocytophaga sp.]MDO5105393.1 YtxH domain-containing protein [Capnocytophaga sp.]